LKASAVGPTPCKLTASAAPAGPRQQLSSRRCMGSHLKPRTSAVGPDRVRWELAAQVAPAGLRQQLPQVHRFPVKRPLLWAPLGCGARARQRRQRQFHNSSSAPASVHSQPKASAVGPHLGAVQAHGSGSGCGCQQAARLRQVRGAWRRALLWGYPAGALSGLQALTPSSAPVRWWRTAKHYGSGPGCAYLVMQQGQAAADGLRHKLGARRKELA